MNNCGKSIFVILSYFFILTCLCCSSQAGLSKDYIPKGKTIPDSYLEQLFAPEFPYESIKVVDTKEGKRYVVIKARENVSDKMRLDYEKILFITEG